MTSRPPPTKSSKRARGFPSSPGAVIMRILPLCAVAVLALSVAPLPADDKADAPVTPKEVVKLFNGKDLTGLTTWLKKTKHEDPSKVFSVVDGVIRASGADLGYVAT